MVKEIGKETTELKVVDRRKKFNGHHEDDTKNR